MLEMEEKHYISCFSAVYLVSFHASGEITISSRVRARSHLLRGACGLEKNRIPLVCLNTFGRGNAMGTRRPSIS